MCRRRHRASGWSVGREPGFVVGGVVRPTPTHPGSREYLNPNPNPEGPEKGGLPTLRRSLKGIASVGGATCSTAMGGGSPGRRRGIQERVPPTRVR